MKGQDIHYVIDTDQSFFPFLIKTSPKHDVSIPIRVVFMPEVKLTSDLMTFHHGSCQTLDWSAHV